MSIGYPSRRRARHAFERGVRDGYQRKRRPNPYQNPWMIDLYARGVAEGLKGRAPKPLAVKLPAPKQQKRPQSRSQGRRYEEPYRRSFTNPPRRGGGWR